MELSKRPLMSVVAFILAVVLVLLVGAWGGTGHRIINGNVALDLPSAMQLFVNNAAFLAQHASDADNRKGGDSQKPFVAKEGPRHFIDLEAYPEFSTKSIPEDFGTLIAKYDSATVFDLGIVPWAAVWTLDSLTAQLRRADTSDALQSAADLGHYVGDAHQPLHATMYYGNGTSSDRPGSNSGNIHSRYETTMISMYQNMLTFRPDSVLYIANPIDFMFSIVYESNTYVNPLYEADISARQVTGWDGSGTPPQVYYDSLWSKTRWFTELQFQRATSRYADLLYTAWVNSRSTTSTPLYEFASSSVIPNTGWLGQNYPNPFNPSTKISFHLEQPAHISLGIYTLQGRQIAVVMDKALNAGTYESTFDASPYNLSSGIYLYRLHIHTATISRSLTNKMLLLK